jgi:macrolide-specific efflux system membrane fusion protein
MRLRLPVLLRRPPNLALNLGLGVLAVAGAAWAYQLVTGTEGAASASTGLTRTVAVSQGDVSETVSASGSVESAATATADFATQSTVTSIQVKVGDTVKKGQVLARADATESQAQLDAAEANLSAANASLDRAEESGDDASIATAEAQVTEAQASVTEAERAVAGTVLKAPMAGTVIAINGSIGGSSAGSSASTGADGGGSTGFMELANLASMQVSASFAEADATKLKQGQAAAITWSALAGATAQGKVASIAPTATTSNNVNSYAVVVSIDDLPEGIRIGQTVTAVVTVAEARGVLRVPAAAVRAVGNGHVVTVVSNGTNEVRQVEIGVEGDSFTEVTSGLTAGEQVMIVTDTSTGNTGNFPGGGVFPGGGFGGGGPGGGGGGGPAGGGGGGGGGGGTR